MRRQEDDRNQLVKRFKRLKEACGNKADKLQKVDENEKHEIQEFDQQIRNARVVSRQNYMEIQSNFSKKLAQFQRDEASLKKKITKLEAAKKKMKKK